MDVFTPEETAVCVKAKVDTGEVDQAIEKVERLSGLLKEAKSLADDLASKVVGLKFEIQR